MAQAKYLSGNVMGHMLNLASASALGMVAIFAVDLADMYFISLLGVPELAAAVGFAGILFFTTASIGMALSVASGTLVAQALGRDRQDDAAQNFIDVALMGLTLGVAATVGLHFAAPSIFTLLGATGEVHAMALSYFRTVNLTLPLLIVGMTSGAALRASGLVRLSLIATLSGGAVNAVLDPLFIFGFDWGLDGAAYATVISRFVVVGVSLHGAVVGAGLLKGARLSRVLGSLSPVFAVALPSLITSLSTPIASAYVTSRLAAYGPEVIAGVSVFGRLLPLAFVGLFTLTMSLSPIIGQNFGAGEYSRVKSALRNAALFSVAYTLVAASLLVMLGDLIAGLFGLTGDARLVLLFYCRFLAFTYCFYGFHLAASQAFTNLGHPGYSTVANLVRDIGFMLPLVALGGAVAGMQGILVGQYTATILSGSIALLIAWRLVSKLEALPAGGDPKSVGIALPDWLCRGGLFHRPVTAHGVVRGH